MTQLAVLLATFFCSGYAPIAPGTAGSAAALLLYGALVWTGVSEAVPWVALVTGGIGVWAASVTASRAGDDDPGIVVIDEVAGMLVTLMLLPLSVTGVVLGFFLFRAFDIVKPFPAAQSERLPSGWGIMADDIVAGLYAHGVLRLAAWIWPAALLDVA